MTQLEPESVAYNVPIAFRLRGRLDASALHRSLDHLLSRHESLRTTFRFDAAAPTQVIHPPHPLPLPLTDLRHLPPAERDRRCSLLIEERARRPFDLIQGPVLRADLLRLGEQEHIALLVMHHIVSDAWSMGVLVREVAALYTAYAAGTEPELEELPVQYADYAAWQREWLQGEVYERQLEYWRRQLADSPAVLELPADRVRPPVQTYGGGVHRFTLSGEVAARLRALSRSEGATLFMVLLAGFKVLLRRYTGQGDIVVGTPIANRSREEVEGLVGFFANTLVLRTKLEGEATFREVLGKVREVCLGAYTHQDMPFGKLVEELQPQRDPSYPPFFQVVFVLQNAGTTKLQLPGLSLERMEFDTGTAKVDLTVELSEAGDVLNGSIEYNSDLFDAETIERLVGHFTTLLEAAISNPDRRTKNLPLLTQSELRQLTTEWNETKADYAQDSCIHELFEDRVERTPEATALVYEGRALSYAELNARANQLAHFLRTRGVGPEFIVGLCLERSHELVVALLATLKAGGAYLPLDPNYPPQRLRYMVEDAGCRLVLTMKALAAGLSSESPAGESSGAEVLCLDERRKEIEEQDAGNVSSGIGPENLAYIIYTSGSTGKPKGVMLRHRGGCNLIAAQIRAFDLGPDNRVLQFASLSFDASFFEIVMALLVGATLHLAKRDELVPGPDLARLLQSYEITNVTLPPSSLAMLPGEEFPDLRTIIVAGEACSSDLVAQWGEGRRFFNAYGPTETTVWATVAECRNDGRKPDIGRPISNVATYLLDEHLNPVPVGVRGEIHIGGAGLARGYLARRGLTAERFIPNPFGTEAGARLYKTGDLARYRPNGSIEFLGRIDHQVKIRGFRIELGEIKEALDLHPEVIESAVIVREDTPDDKKIVAYMVIEPGAAPSIGELRDFLKERLPEYMLPSAFVTLDELPVTSSGKVDRQALPAPDQERPNLDEAFAAPRNPTEEILSGIWAKVLEVEHIGVDDDFFELGGHSLLAKQVTSRACDTFHVNLPLRSLFNNPTVAALAKEIEALIREDQDDLLPPLTRASRDDALPLSYSQQRLWFLSLLEPHSNAYNVPIAFRLRGRLDASALHRSLDHLLSRHESLRTTFRFDAAAPTQLIHPPHPLPLPLTDLRHLPPAERDRRCSLLIEERARRPFDLVQGPVLRADLVQLGEQEHIALLVMHHIVSDAWSMGVLVREVAALYTAYAAGTEPELEELPVQYADYAAWQREWLQGEVYERQLEYWRGQLEGAPSVLELPADRPRPPVQTYGGG
ncbi:MAG: amino acid adenylation domain-containing protein, partial [Pyrinomonadaceae bacterium]